MQRLIALALVLFALQSPLVAKDWQAIIQQLERGPRSKETTKKIAVCSNNLALEYERKKDWNNAEKWMKKAYDMDRSEKLYQKHLGDIYASQAMDLYRNRTSSNKGGSMHARAKLLAQRAVAYNRELAGAHLLIAMIEYEAQHLAAAKSAISAAKRINPNYPGLSEIMAKVEREQKVEKKFTKVASSFFDIRYESSVDKDTAAGLRYAMRTARDVVGRDFNFRPNHKTTLLVYSSKVYSQLRLGPHWSAGLYDGKIRLPLDGEDNLKFAVATLFHEYTHAIIDDVAGSNCPHWVNEGLAEIQGQKVEPRKIIYLHSAAKSDNLIPLDNLSSAFKSSSTATVRLGYEQSHSVASYMVEKYHYRLVRKLMAEFKKGAALEPAVRNTFGVPLARLETDWKKWLLAKL